MPELQPIPEYKPSASSIEELEKQTDLTDQQLILELARLRYSAEFSNQTMDLLTKISNNKLKDLMKIVALSDIPGIEEMLKDESKKEQILKYLKTVQQYKDSITKH